MGVLRRLPSCSLLDRPFLPEERFCELLIERTAKNLVTTVVVNGSHVVSRSRSFLCRERRRYSS